MECAHGMERFARWPAKVWSIVLLLSTFVILWMAFVFKLIGFGVNF